MPCATRGRHGRPHPVVDVIVGGLTAPGAAVPVKFQLPARLRVDPDRLRRRRRSGPRARPGQLRRRAARQFRLADPLRPAAADARRGEVGGASSATTRFSGQGALRQHHRRDRRALAEASSPSRSCCSTALTSPTPPYAEDSAASAAATHHGTASSSSRLPQSPRCSPPSATGFIRSPRPSVRTPPRRLLRQRLVGVEPWSMPPAPPSSLASWMKARSDPTDLLHGNARVSPAELRAASTEACASLTPYGSLTA